MTKLNDTQRILLSHASRRDTGSLHPLPDTATAGAGLTRAITALIAKGFAEERETRDPAAIHRRDGDIGYGVFVTEPGLAAIGVDVHIGAVAEETAPPTPSTPRISKTALVIALLANDGGATLADLIAATGWLPHTTRAALTGLRKKGHRIERDRLGETTRYRIVAAG